MGGARRILLVDDDAALCRTVSDFLGMEGFDVQTVSDGRSALRALDGAQPDLIVLDINMPGMGGVEFLKEARGLGRLGRVPVLVFTARANMASFFEDVDVAGFVAKPCEPAALLEQVRGVLGEAAGRPPGPTRPRLLLVEDDPAEGERLRDLLRAAGYDAVLCASGSEALEQAVLRTPDLAVVRFELPQMQGDKLAATLHAMPRTTSVPVVLYTADPSADGGACTMTRTRIERFVAGRDGQRLLDAVGALAAAAK